MLLLEPLRALVNRGIRSSSTAAGLAGGLEGRSLALGLSGTPLRLTLVVRDGLLDLEPGTPDTPDTLVEGPPLSLLGLLGSDPQAPLRSGQVRLSGSTEVADRYRELLAAAAPDLEEELSRLLGDPAAHQAGRLARGGARWAREAAGSLARSLGDYLREERRTLPARPEVEEWIVAVDTLRSDVERAEARLARLVRRQSPQDPSA
jgi:ubiquinone biosynthesis accessory factor UbiJ